MIFFIVLFFIQFCNIDISNFSDLNIALANGDVPAHKFVLSSRSDKWGVPDLTEVNDLGI